MILYRICKLYPPDNNPIDGKGAAKYGGRWNSEGIKMVYTASSLALARSELARHTNLATIPDGYRIYEIEIPDQEYEKVTPLPPDWNSNYEPESTKKMGDACFLNPKVLAIAVPSVVDNNSFNYLLNPQSSAFGLVKVIKEYPFIP